MVEQKEIAAAINVLKILSETIRELGRVPNGELWAGCMSKLSFNDYTQAINIIKGAGIVKEENNVLIWIGGI